MRFDTHLHVWWPGDGAAIRIRARIPDLDRDFSLDAVRPTLEGAGVTRVILVSAAQQEGDNERLLSVAHDNRDLVAGVVGWLDLEATSIGERIGHYARDPAWRGVRLPLTIHEDRACIRRPAIRRGLEALRDHGAMAEVLAATDQLADVATTLATVPGLRTIIDHAGNPDIAGPPTQTWLKGIAALARLPDSVCKVSSFWGPGDPPVDDERALAFFSHVVGTFGPGRMIAAANWPPSSLGAPYARHWDRLDRLAEACGLDATARRAIREGTAQRLLCR